MRKRVVKANVSSGIQKMHLSVLKPVQFKVALAGTLRRDIDHWKSIHPAIPRHHPMPILDLNHPPQTLRTRVDGDRE